MKKRAKNYQARYPLQIELRYRRLLRAMVQQLRQFTLAELEAEAPRMAAQAAQMRGDAFGDPNTPQGWAELLAGLLARIRDRMLAPLQETNAQVADIARGIGNHTRGEWRKIIRKAYGVDITAGEPWMADALSGWEQNNIGLIKGIPDTALSQIRERVTTALLEGRNPRELIETVRERLDVSESRAELIARDQVTKLRGNLDEARQTRLGVTSYFWRTMGDERVRPTHKAKSDRKYAWNKPPADTGHPGHDVRCRCYADPILPEMTEAEVGLL